LRRVAIRPGVFTPEKMITRSESQFWERPVWNLLSLRPLRQGSFRIRTTRQIFANGCHKQSLGARKKELRLFP
jgi:hypothetical protein